MKDISNIALAAKRERQGTKMTLVNVSICVVRVIIALWTSRGKSLIIDAYEISVETIGFLRDFYENNRISSRSVRDF